MKRSAITTVLLVLAIFSGFSQEKNKKTELTGYLTTMQNAIFDSISGPVFYDNILHNRLNLKAYLNDHLTFAAEFRNRLFTGDMVRSYPGYPGMTTADEGWIDMSWKIIEKNTFFINSTLDRLWLDLNYEKFQIRIGRQRINWGQTFVWNPNDIFNAYSFFDVDYIERPGSDAVRFQYYPTWSSSVEVAVKADNNDDITAAGLYRFSKWGYDIQFLAGYSNSSDIVAGAGWSGHIGSASFRGEGTWFHPIDSFTDTTGMTIITAGFDRILKDNSMAQIQVMYCNNPLDLKNFTNLYTGTLSAKDLAFSKFSAFGQFTWAASPLWKISLSGMWFPDLEGYFAGPSVEFSMAENVDSSVFWQHFDGKPGDSESRINLVFLRIKYSF